MIYLTMLVCYDASQMGTISGLIGKKKNRRLCQTDTQSTDQPVKISTNPQSGIAPLNSSFTIDTNINNTITSYRIDFEGDGVTDLETTDVTSITHIYETPGIYYPTVTVTDNQYNTHTETTVINVLDKTEMDALLKVKWEGMKAAMGSGDVEGAIGYFVDISKDSYRQQFALLSQVLPQIVNEMGEVTLVRVRERFAEYDLRTIRNGTNYSFQILFVRDTKGIWGIRSF